MIDKSFSAWIIVRNDSFSEFRMYDNREFSESKIESNTTIKNPSYAKGFEPDFIFFGKRVNENSGILSIECFIEAKGEHLAGDESFQGRDIWKEKFLECVQGKYEIPENPNKNLHIPFLPFFKISEIKEFDKRFKEFLKSKIDD